MKSKKIKEFELPKEFQEKYPDITQICLQGKNLIFTTIEGKFVRSKYYEDDITKTLQTLREEFLTNTKIEISFVQDSMEDFLKDFDQILTWGAISPTKEDEEEEDDRSHSEILIDLVSENASLLFKDEYDTPYARIHNRDHYELINMRGEKFKRYITNLYYDSEGKAPNIESVNSAVSVLRARAEYRSETIPLSLRVASHNGEFYYDLTNRLWQCIKTTKEGWQLIDSDQLPTPLFKRHNQIAQVIPVKDYESDIFDKFLSLTNLKREDDKILLMVYLVTLFIPNIQHVALQLHGGQGGAKSLLERFIKRTVDPAVPELLTIHGDRMEFIQQIMHNYLVFYDNLESVPY
jgi:hypothetical protein